MSHRDSSKIHIFAEAIENRGEIWYTIYRERGDISVKEEEVMFEYKVVVLKVNDAETIINRHARDGWKLVTMVALNDESGNVMATLERPVK